MRGISQVLVLVNDCELDDVEKLGLELEALGTRLQGPCLHVVPLF